MRIRFDGKTAVVSGAGHGFGRCIAETFAQWVLAYLAAIYPTQNLRKPLRLEAHTGAESRPNHRFLSGGGKRGEVEYVNGPNDEQQIRARQSGMAAAAGAESC